MNIGQRQRLRRGLSGSFCRSEVRSEVTVGLHSGPLSADGGYVTTLPDVVSSYRRVYNKIKSPPLTHGASFFQLLITGSFD